MCEELLGYLLGALEPDEERELEARLATDPELRKQLEELRPLLRPLTAEPARIDPPAGLAARICAQVARCDH
jgi:anti-sigma-K factor RskA